MNNNLSRKGGMKLIHAAVDVAVRFVLANLLVVVPMVWLVAWFTPDRLEVEVLAPKSNSLRIGFAEPDEAGKDNVDFNRVVTINGTSRPQTVKAYFSDPVDVDRLVLQFQGDAHEAQILSISVLRHTLFRSVLSHDELAHAFAFDGNTYRPQKGRMANWELHVGSDYRIVKILWMFEFGVLLAVLLLYLCPLDGFSIRTHERVWSSLAVASATSLLVCVIIPFQSYLANQSAFDCGVGELALSTAGLAVCSCAALFALLFCASFFWGFLPHIALLSLAVYEYLETGVLAIGMPSLNGEIWFFTNANRKLLDSVILGIIVVLPLCLCRWVRPFIRWVALGLVVMSLLSLFDIRRETVSKPQFGIMEKFITSKVETLKQAFYSSKRNVLMLILDSTTVDASCDALESDVSLKKDFSGFTSYRKNVGMGAHTGVGLPGLMTGAFPGTKNGNEYAQSIFSTNSFVSSFLPEKGSRAAFVLQLLYDGGISTQASAQKSDSKRPSLNNRRCESVFSRRMNDMLALSLRDVVRFRMTPFYSKSWYLAIILQSIDNSFSIDRETSLYPLVSNLSEKSDAEIALHVYHTAGSHPPLNVDEKGNSIPLGSRDNYAGYVAQTHFVLRRVAKLFQGLKERGLYDKMTIVITADHGTLFDKPGKRTQPSPRAYPLLWVKPENAHGDFRFSDVPTSHAHIAALLRKLAATPLDASQIAAILRSENRIYCESDKCWSVDADGKAHEIPAP